MARVTAQGWLDKWSNNLNAASPYIKAGVQAVQVAPGQQAAAAQDRMLAGVTASVTSGKWAQNVAKVSLSEWQNAMINKGMGRIAAGTAAAKVTKVAAITTLLNNVDQAAAAANNLPKGGLEQGIARATAFMRAMSQASNKG